MKFEDIEVDDILKIVETGRIVRIYYILDKEYVENKRGFYVRDAFSNMNVLSYKEIGEHGDIAGTSFRFFLSELIQLTEEELEIYYLKVLRSS